MMNRYSRCLPCVALLLAGLLSGCAVTPADCDPRHADVGFATKFNCNTQGVYAQRVEQKERILLDEQKTNQLFRASYQAIEQQRLAVGGDLAQQQRQSAELNRSLNALLAELKKKASGNQKVKKEISALEQQMKDINRQENASVMQKQVELQNLRSKLAGLESDLGLR